MIRTHRKRLVTLLLIMLAVLAVVITTYTEKKADARQYCTDPCNPYCNGT